MLPLISAGEFFELLRPAAYVLSALLSIWVLASARRRGFRLLIALVWALGTFLLPFVVLPVYLIVLIFRARSQQGRHSVQETESDPQTERKVSPIKHRLLLPTVYGVLLLSLTGLYLYRDYYSVDAHLARATQAKLASQTGKTFREYRAALSLEDNAHTHKLLGIELAEAGEWAEALKEFRLAEQGGEPDELLLFRIAQALNAKGDHDQAAGEYEKFLRSHACTQELPDYRCEGAREVMKKRR